MGMSGTAGGRAEEQPDAARRRSRGCRIQMAAARSSSAARAISSAALAGCGDDRECRARYKADQRALTGVTPTDAQAKDACDRSSGRGYYGGSRARGGGSGFGK